ncbi:MAG: TlpA disulfide reductase family protein [Planctomycetaceae bacterium]
MNPRSCYSILFVLSLCLMNGTFIAAQDPETDTAVPAADPAAPIEVPEGTTEEMLDFIRKVQQMPLPGDDQSQAAAVAFLRKQITAVLAACDRIDSLKPDEKILLQVVEQRFGAYRNLKKIDEQGGEKLQKYVDSLKKDERPEVQRLVRGHELESKTPGFFKLSTEDRQQLIDDLLSYMDDYGLDRTSFGVASGLGEALEYSDAPETAAPIYTKLVREMKKVGDPRLTDQIARYEGTARRLGLPGNFLELEGKTADGEDFDWKSYRGKVVLVDFWASWCGPCRAEIPNMKAQLEKWKDKGFDIVGITLDQTKAAYQKCIEDEGITWISLMSDNEQERSWNHPLAVKFGISGIPMAILVDKEGKVVSLSAVGDELNSLLEKMLGDEKSESPDKE